MSGKHDKKLRKEARRMARKENEDMIPKFKAMVNHDFTIRERLFLAWKIIWRIF